MEYNNHEGKDPVDEKYPKRDYTDEELGQPLTEEEKKEQEELKKQLEEEEKELRKIEKKLEEEIEKTNKEHEDAEKDTNTRDIFEGMSTSDSNKTPTQPEEPINHNSIFD
ncbi:hypothetical protein ChPV071 [Cheloniid poxvirus 1]|nr:hypothetical protein ChPV071 [Cheloniid poxvirus 1]